MNEEVESIPDLAAIEIVTIDTLAMGFQLVFP
jgi:hypothetical protein